MGQIIDFAAYAKDQPQPRGICVDATATKQISSLKAQHSDQIEPCRVLLFQTVFVEYQSDHSRSVRQNTKV